MLGNNIPSPSFCYRPETQWSAPSDYMPAQCGKEAFAQGHTYIHTVQQIERMHKWHNVECCILILIFSLPSANSLHCIVMQFFPPCLDITASIIL